MAELLPALQPATAVLVVGMAGSGKSTFAAKLAKEVDERTKVSCDAGDATAEGRRAGAGAGTGAGTGSGAYFLNLDPAVGSLGYPPNVDIRDTIDYAQVMSQYNLGPNGGILTSLNLFTTKFDQVLSILEQRAATVDTIVVDTPGQIEIFTWSASGTLITSSLLSSSIPTVVAYIVDTPRTTSPATFMSNMLYACSIMYKTKLPFVLVFNKTDQQDWKFAKDWMEDFENFQKALKVAGNPTRRAVPLAGAQGTQNVRAGGGEDDDGTFMNSLMNSMALVLDEFYTNLNAVGVSSVTGAGFDDFFKAVAAARQEFVDEVRPEVESLAREKQEKREKEKQDGLRRLMRDMKLGAGDAAGGAKAAKAKPGPNTASAKTAKDEEEEADDMDDDWEEEYEGDGQIVDPDTDEERPDYDDMFAGSQTAGRSYGADGTVWPRPA